MLLHDISAGDEVRLELIINDTPYQIPTHAVDVAPGKVWIEVFRFEKQVIDLSDPKFYHIRYNLHGYDKAKLPYCWDDMELSMEMHNGLSCYLLSCSPFKSAGRAENKRMKDRVKVSVPAELQWRQKNFNIPVTLYDISDSGVAFLANEDAPLINERIIVEIREMIQERKFWIKMECVCVRKMPKDGNILYGCKFQIIDQRLLEYIFAKHMQVRAAEVAESRRLAEEERLRLEAQQQQKEKEQKEKAQKEQEKDAQEQKEQAKKQQA